MDIVMFVNECGFVEVLDLEFFWGEVGILD